MLLLKYFKTKLNMMKASVQFYLVKKYLPNSFEFVNSFFLANNN